MYMRLRLLQTARVRWKLTGCHVTAGSVAPASASACSRAPGCGTRASLTTRVVGEGARACERGASLTAAACASTATASLPQPARSRPSHDTGDSPPGARRPAPAPRAAPRLRNWPSCREGLLEGRPPRPGAFTPKRVPLTRACHRVCDGEPVSAEFRASPARWTVSREAARGEPRSRCATRTTATTRRSRSRARCVCAARVSSW